MAKNKKADKKRIKGINAMQKAKRKGTLVLEREEEAQTGIPADMKKSCGNVRQIFPSTSNDNKKKSGLIRTAAAKAWDNKLEIIAGGTVGFGTRSILTYFGVAAALTTGPAGVLGAALTGAIAGTASSIIREGISVYRGKKEKKGWFKRALLRGVCYGALGGLSGGVLSHWSEVSEFIKDNVSETLGDKMSSAGKLVSDNAHKIGETLYNTGTAVGSFFALKEAVASTSETIAKPPKLPVKNVFRGVVAEKYGNVQNSFQKAKEVLLNKDYKKPMASTMKAAKEAIKAKIPEMKIPQDTLDAVARKSAAAAKKAAEAARYLAFPKGFKSIVSQEVFDMIPEDIREKLAKKYAGKLGAKGKILLMSDTAYYLLNKSFKSFGQMPVSARKTVFNLFRQAATIARDNNLTGTELGRRVNGNLSYMYRAGIGTAKDMFKACSHALLGEGSFDGNKSLAALKKQAPKVLRYVTSKLPLMNKYSAGLSPA